MKKFFTYALAAALSTAAAQAQILKYGAEAGETQPDTVNWYGDWVEAGGSIDFEDKNAASGEYAVYVGTPDGAAANANARWERVFKFDNLKIKENTNYRVRISAQAPSNANIHVALMCGDENCDMPFALKTSAGRHDQYRVLNGWSDYQYTTKSVLIRYTTDEYQKSEYHNVKADDPNELGANRFLRLSFLEAGDYYWDDVVVEEADIAGAYCGAEAIKIDFGFPTNIAALVKENGGVVLLPNDCATVKINGAAVELTSVELKDGALYIFPDESIEEDDEVLVSFNAAGTGIKYSGEQTPGDGVDVPSFTDEKCYFDETVEATSEAYTEPKLVTSYPEDGSFEMDENINEFSFTFDRDVNLAKVGAQIMVNGKAVKLTNTTADKEGKTATFKYEGGELSKNSYTIYIYDVESAFGISAIDEFEVTFETGKVSVAGVEYTDVMTVDVQGENNMASTNWTCYKGDEVFEAAGADQRTFVFPEEGKYVTGFYLSQRGDASASLTYGEKDEYPFTLPAGNVQINVLASYWQTNSGSFLFDLIDSEGNVVASGSGVATAQQPDFGTPCNEVSRIAFNVENCKAGNYVVKLTTNTGGFGNAIIVWGLDVKTYVVGQGETADNQVVVDGSFADVPNDGVPAAGTGWHAYGGEPGDELLEPASVAGQRTRFFTGMGIKNLPNAFYNRNLGGEPHKWRLTYGETKHTDGTVCEDEDGNNVEKALELDVARYNFSWYICNWKGDANTYYFKIYDEDGEEVYSREDECTVKCDGDRNKAVEAVKVEFSWTPKVAGKYTMEWYMTGESMAGGIKIEKMGSLAVYWHTQLNEAIKAAEEERANAEGDEFAGATRDALDKAIAEAKTVTYHTGAEYTAAMERLAQYVKAMADRRQAIADYSNAYAELCNQIESMEGSKFESLESYSTSKALIAKYDGVEGWTIDNETLLPVVDSFKTLKALNTNLMEVGVPAFTDQINKLVATYNEMAEFVPEDQETEGVFELTLEAENEVTDNQDMVKLLQIATTSQVYKAIANGFNFKKTGLEFPDDEPSEDNPYITVDATIDLSGFIRNGVFYAFSTEREIHNTENCNALIPGWEFNAPNGLSLNWGWGGWDGANFPVAPVNVTNQHLGTKWATDFEVWQDVSDIPVGIYSFGASTADDSNLENEELEEKTRSYLYVVVGDEQFTQPFNVETSSNYRQESECRLAGVTITEGKARVGAVCDVDAGFAAVDNAKLLMSAPVEGFDYAAAAKQMDAAFATSVKGIESAPAAGVVSTKYFDLNGRLSVNVNAKGILIRIDTLSDGSTRAVKVLRK